MLVHSFFVFLCVLLLTSCYCYVYWTFWDFASLLLATMNRKHPIGSAQIAIGPSIICPKVLMTIAS